MKWFNRMTLGTKIGLFVLTWLIISLIFFSWLGIQSVNDSVKRTLNERLIIAKVMASQLDEALSHMLMHLQKTANFGWGLSDKEQFESKAGELSGILAGSGARVLNIVFFDNDAKAQQIFPGEYRISRENNDKYSPVQDSLTSGLPAISNLLSDPLSGEPAVIMSTPVFNEEDRIIGALAVSIDIENSNFEVAGRDVVLGKTGYTELVDGNGLILARTNPASPPQLFERSDHPGRFATLISRGEATVGVCHRCHEVQETLVERRRDMLAFAPLSTAPWGVAIRQSEDEALAPSFQLRQRLLLLGLVIVTITALLVWTMMRGIIRPIKTLTSSIKRVAEGDFKVALPFNRQDEIGQLASAFLSMTRDLAKSRQELTKSRDELMVRNEELSALNSIASKVNQSLNLEDVLDNTMQKVLDVTRATNGCIFLRDSESNILKEIGGTGSTGIFKCRQAASATADCSCHQVVREGQTVIVNDILHCPMLTEEVLTKENISSFVSVPLKAKDRIIGVMNITCSDERPFTENDFRILDSIAYHISLAIENSILYDQAKKKEELRGKLLNMVINAQEEERKRIARELHDEYGQSMAVLKINLEYMDTLALPEQSELREKLKQTVALVGEALENLRRLPLALRPYALDQLGLIAAIRAHVQTNLESAGIRVEFETKGLDRRLSPETETVLFRIIQEAIHNIVRHAEAKNVKIKLEVKTDKITAEVCDDGKGFNIESLSQAKDGTQRLGLLGIQERVSLLGGTFNIESSPEKGTRIQVEIPITSPVEIN